MRVRLPHSNGLFLSQKGTQFTDLRASVPDGKRFCPGKRVPVSRIEGNVPHLRAKFTHFVGYLPARQAKRVVFRCILMRRVCCAAILSVCAAQRDCLLLVVTRSENGFWSELR